MHRLHPVAGSLTGSNLLFNSTRVFEFAIECGLPEGESRNLLSLVLTTWLCCINTKFKRLLRNLLMLLRISGSSGHFISV